MDDIKLRQCLDEAAARETGPMRALKVLQAMQATSRDSEDWHALKILNRGITEVQAYIAEDAKRPSYQSDREAIERITVQRDNAEAKVAEMEQRLLTSVNNEGALMRQVAELQLELDRDASREGMLVIRNANLTRRLKEAEERIPPSNASETAPEPPASLKALVERWRLLSHQRRIALQLGDGDTTDFAQCAAELEDVLAKKKLLLTPIYNPRVQADLETMRKRAESAEQTLQLIKDNLP